MKILRYGDRGSLVSLLQKGLKRAGFELEVDGVFGEETRRKLTRFQRREGLTEDGVAGPATEQALGPWYRGYTEHVIRPGDTLWSIAGRYGSRLALLESANPGIDPFRLMAGQRIVVPFAFPVVPGDVPVSGELVGYCVEVQAHGFGGLMTAVVGVNTNGEVTGVAITSHNETLSTGTQALESDYLDQYKGKSGTIRSSGSNAVDTISGATATCDAVTDCVNQALSIVANLDTEGVEYVDGEV